MQKVEVGLKPWQIVSLIFGKLHQMGGMGVACFTWLDSSKDWKCLESSRSEPTGSANVYKYESPDFLQKL